MIEQSANGPAESHPVLRVIHEVDFDGRVIDVQLEAFAGSGDVVALAAWHAARRCHPWIIGDRAAALLQANHRIAVRQVRELLSCADEVLLIIRQSASIDDVRSCSPVQRLREGATDLRGYMRALAGELPATIEPQLRKRFNRAG